MTTQLAICARSGSDQATLEAVPAPASPADGEVLCRTLELGICGTDRDILASREPWLAPGQDRLILGHECLGQIVALGAGVDASWLGQAVVPLVRRPLDPAVHRADLARPGSYIERGIYRADGFGCLEWLDRPEYLLPVPPEVLELAVFAEPQSIAEKAVHEAIAIQSGRLEGTGFEPTFPRTLVTGQGPIAFAAVIAARARGWDVTMVGRDAPGSSRWELAAMLGAHCLDWREIPEPSGQWNESVEEHGFDLVLECTGSDQAMVRAGALLRARGIQVWLGADRLPERRLLAISALMRDAILRNHVYVGVVNSAKRDFLAAFENLGWYLRSGFPVDRLITHRVSSKEALPEYQSRVPGAIKTVIEFS